MEFVVKKLSDSIVSAGTAGGFALVILILLIYGYFKYLMPYLKEFYEIKGEVEKFGVSHVNQNEYLKEITHDLEKLSEKIERFEKDIKQELKNDSKGYYRGSMNHIEKLESQITMLIARSGEIKDKAENDHKNIMIEIAKLQARLEYSNNYMARGIQK
jgi:hemerythrin-like domain-containing protein